MCCRVLNSVIGIDLLLSKICTFSLYLEFVSVLMFTLPLMFVYCKILISIVLVSFLTDA